jgi:hypothetical protein
MANILVGTVYTTQPWISGQATISGTVDIITAPASRPVLLLRRDNLQCVAETRSATDGTYSFANLAEGREWLVIGIDDAGVYNATIADRVFT